MNSKDLSIALGSAVSIALAWNFPGTLLCAILGWVMAYFLVLTLRSTKRPYLTAYISGFLIHPLAFYWLLLAIKNFGGFDYLAATGIFLLFCALSALQYPIFVLLARTSFDRFSRLGITAAVAWTVSEMISVRIFPWHLGHTQLAIPALSQLAGLGGAPLITFMMIWLMECVVCKRNRFAPLATLILLIAIGWHFRPPVATEKIPVLLVQANIATKDKRNVRMILINRERYRELTQAHLSDEELVVWPETVIMDGIPDSIQLRIQDKRIPTFEKPASLLTGAISYDSRKNLFNSAFLVTPDGAIPAPYHKRILMPFGEYTPFGNYIPFLKELNSNIGEFTPGRAPEILSVPLRDGSDLKLSPLICYEDVLPRLGREAVNAGAEVLVNLTNDAWFGTTVAPRQHHLIAAFRAIESGRYLIRSTNSGFTAVVDPYGSTVASIPEWSEGIARAKIARPTRAVTPYLIWGDWPWWGLSTISILGLIRIFSRRRLV